MAALDQLQNIEIQVEDLNGRYNGSMSLLLSGSASSLHPKIRREADKYGLNNGRDAHAVSERLRLMGDLNLHILAPIDEVKSKIRIAHGALYNLIGTLPSVVLDKYFLE